MTDTPTPLERLLAEAIPTGTFGHALPPPPEPEPPPRPVAPWTPEEQDAHWADLCKALGTPGAKRPHLRLVADESDAA